MHDVKISDDLFNPLFPDSDQFKFATFEDFAAIDKRQLEDKGNFDFELELGVQLSGQV